MHFGGRAIESLFKNSVGSYSTERIEQLHINFKAYPKDEEDERFTHIEQKLSNCNFNKRKIKNLNTSCLQVCCHKN